MTVYFVGAGPGAADLITVRGARIIASSPVCLYAGSLVPRELLATCPAEARVIDSSRMTLDAIVAEMVDATARGEDVARVHSGDPSLYSAVAEQARRLDAAGADYEIVPGVPSFAAASAALKRELTVPEVSQTVVLTRISTLSTAMPDGEDLATLARSRATMVIHLGARQIDPIAVELARHYGVDCPVAVVAFASRDDETIVRGTLADIAAATVAAGIVRTAVIVVGRVLAAEGFPDSFLYSSARRALDH
ncbi:precorrin-4 C(11)-methyltransferase [Rhodococcoides kroppenstedtii]|uniref:precorrin-4 C(11)-methyltransferase n=1 Tax=Rhodococcoides kroppenstedtii TaxID=293050 RepID=UPI00362561E5